MAFRQSASATTPPISSTSVTVTLASSTNNGSLLTLMFYSNGTTSRLISSISMGSCVFTKRKQEINATNNSNLELWDCFGGNQPGGQTSCVVNLNSTIGAGSVALCYLLEFTDSITSVDTSLSKSDTYPPGVTSGTTSSFTNAQANEVIVACFGESFVAGQTPITFSSPTNGFTLLTTISGTPLGLVSVDFLDFAPLYKIVNSVASQSTGVSFSPSTGSYDSSIIAGYQIVTSPTPSPAGRRRITSSFIV